MKNTRLILFILTTLVAFDTAAMAQSEAGEVGKQPRTCFSPNSWAGWRAPDNQTIYIRVGMRDIYRLDLAGSYPGLRSGGAYLIQRHRGISTICSPLDFDLRLSVTPGQSTPIIVRSMTRLNASDAASLPANARP